MPCLVDIPGRPDLFLNKNRREFYGGVAKGKLEEGVGGETGEEIVVGI